MFAERRRQRLRQGLFDAPVEKVAENIVEDLLTTVLDWSLDDVNLQIGRADIVLSDNGYKRLVLEVKRPGTLIWHRQAIAAALDQALRYASAQNVSAVAVSDGTMLYAADLAAGGTISDRALAALDTNTPPRDLWWVSVHGIYRPCPTVTSDLAWRAADTAVLAHPRRHARPQVSPPIAVLRLRGRPRQRGDLETALPPGNWVPRHQAPAQSDPIAVQQLPRRPGQNHSARSRARCSGPTRHRSRHTAQTSLPVRGSLPRIRAGPPGTGTIWPPGRCWVLFLPTAAITHAKPHVVITSAPRPASPGRPPGNQCRG